MRFALRIFVVAAVACIGVNVNADIVNFTATIDQSQENPPTGSPATGFATITFDDAVFSLSWDIQWSGLSGAATGMHFHDAPVGVNGPIVVDIGGISGLTSPSIGSTTINAAILSSLLTDNLYINIHSAQHPGGEIRGQVLRQIPEPASTVLVAALFGVVCLRRRR